MRESNRAGNAIAIGVIAVLGVYFFLPIPLVLLLWVGGLEPGSAWFEILFMPLIWLAENVAFYEDYIGWQEDLFDWLI